MVGGKKVFNQVYYHSLQIQGHVSVTCFCRKGQKKETVWDTFVWTTSHVLV